MANAMSAGPVPRLSKMYQEGGRAQALDDALTAFFSGPGVIQPPIAANLRQEHSRGLEAIGLGSASSQEISEHLAAAHGAKWDELATMSLSELRQEHAVAPHAGETHAYDRPHYQKFG